MADDGRDKNSERRKAREARLAEALRLNLRRRKAAGASPEPQAEAEKSRDSAPEAGSGRRS